MFRTPWDGMIYFDRQMQRIQEAFEQLDTDVSLFIIITILLL